MPDGLSRAVQNVCMCAAGRKRENCCPFWRIWQWIHKQGQNEGYPSNPFSKFSQDMVNHTLQVEELPIPESLLCRSALSCRANVCFRASPPIKQTEASASGSGNPLSSAPVGTPSTSWYHSGHKRSCRKLPHDLSKQGICKRAGGTAVGVPPSHLSSGSKRELAAPGFLHSC